MLDINLIGNVIVDRVYKVRVYPVEGESNLNEGYNLCLGGLGNLLESFSLHKSKLNIGLQAAVAKDENLNFIQERLRQYKKKLRNLNCYLSNSKSYDYNSEALILSDLSKSERTSLVRWGACLDLSGIKYKNAHWSHISYLDLVTKIDMKSLRKSCNFLSADLCLSRMSIFEIKRLKDRLKFLDILFISPNETKPHYDSSKDKGDLRNSIHRLIKDVKFQGTIISHSKKSIEVFRKSGLLEELALPTPRKNLNTLGAGDWLCANFIRHHLDSDNELNSIIKSCEYAYKTTTKDLINRGEKI
ncbi:MAG: hypothetical protein KBC84_09160 [Proteobacteria bacterium]|nr:hypothetical protein [Pseudomonadota bacterium]